MKLVYSQEKPRHETRKILLDWNQGKKVILASESANFKEDSVDSWLIEKYNAEEKAPDRQRENEIDLSGDKRKIQ